MTGSCSGELRDDVRQLGPRNGKHLGVDADAARRATDDQSLFGVGIFGQKGQQMSGVVEITDSVGNTYQDDVAGICWIQCLLLVPTLLIILLIFFFYKYPIHNK